MQPSIPPGTILQNRYRLTKTLGQGGFGRTYIAEDQDRFNELCVIKEYSPGQTGTYALQKSKELFLREAQVLYQIQHPQIPQFRATFMQAKRLFLVQDYVQGKTYRALLDERLEQGHTFSEAEAVQFIQQMLPVLEHIHSQGIIHRDISPDNIILRESDRLPVLIDFGTVKEGIIQAQTPEDAPQGTTVGKIGYSPLEQLQTGQVYPNSDIYALAVTAVVLMTGRKPQELFDQMTMTWRWHQWVPTLSPWFANILNRMLSARPNNRYQSATELAQVIRSLAGLISAPVSSTDAPTQLQAKSTIAQKSTTVNSVSRSPSQPRPNVPIKSTTNPITSHPWALAVLVSGIGLFIVIAPLVLISSLIPKNKLQTSQKISNIPASVPTLSPSNVEITPPVPVAIATSPSNVEITPPVPVQIATSIPASTPISVDNTQSELVIVQLGENISRQGNLKASQTITYIIPARQGQQLNLSLTQGSVMNVLAPGQEEIAKQVTQWSGVISRDGDYSLQISNAQGVSENNFTLNINLAAATQPTVTTNDTQIPTTTPLPNPTNP